MRALVVLARLPLSGRVKPRLAAKVTNTLAIQFYQACAEKTIVESAKCEGLHYLFYSDGTRQQALEWTTAFHQEAVELKPQASKTDAGGRTNDAFQQVFAAGAEMVVLISPDVPDMDANLISNAFAALKSSDVVFGPTYDGGYYLVGLKAFYPSLFEGVHWGTNEVLHMVEGRANRAGLTMAPITSLPRLYDIDTFDSLCKWVELPSSPINPLFGLAVAIKDEGLRVQEALAETGYALLSP